MQLLKKIWVVGLIGPFACGPKTPSVKNYSDTLPNIELPEFESQASELGLDNPNSSTKIFDGSILLWNPDQSAYPEKTPSDKTPSDIAQILGRSTEINMIDAVCKSVEFQDDKLWIEYKSARDNEQVLQAKLNNSASEILKTYEAKIKAESEDHNLLMLSAETVDSSIKENTEDFERFCDAALADFAGSDFLLDNEFSSRPTPLGICEGVYARKSYFTDSECVSPKAMGMGNYVSCFWGESGILKSSITFHKKPSKGGMRDLNTLEKETLKAAFLEPSWLDFLKENKKSISDGSFKSSKMEETIFIRTKKITPRALLLKYETQSWIDLDLRLPDLWTDASSDVVAINFELNHRLHNVHKIVGAKPELSSLRLRKLADLSNLSPKIYGTSFASCVKEIDNKAASLIQEISNQIQKKIDINQTRKDLRTSHAEEFNACALSRDKKRDLRAFLQTSPVALALWPSSELTVDRRSDDTLQVSLKLLNGTARGCASLSGNLETPKAQCHDPKTESPLTVEVDPTSGMITLRMDLSDERASEDFGFQYAPKSEKSAFNLISDDAWKAQDKLVVTLFPRTYKSVDFFSGSAKFISNGVTSYEGTASFSRKVLGDKLEPL